jgi:nitroreductase
MVDSPHPKIAHPDHDILDVIRHRWSPQAFDPSRDIPQSDVRRLFEAARWAPSSRNEQPWRFVVTDRHRSADAFTGLHVSLTPRNQVWAASAPMLVLVAVRPTHELTEAVNPVAWYDAGQAVAFLTLQATAMDLATRQMRGFDPERARQACAVPAPFEPAVVMAIGYPGDPQTLGAAQREAEMKPRARRALGEFVFEGTWGMPLGS